MQPGDIITWERTFTREDVEAFCRISGDYGRHHVTPDEHGRLMVHGLLTATLPTKIGGKLNFIARKTEFIFLRPVFSGDTIRCEVTITHYEQQDGKIDVKAGVECFNQDGKKVLEGSFEGIIRR